MSESQDQDEPQVGIDDEALPDDLQPSEDNPLAEGLHDGETVDDLLSGGKDAEQIVDETPDKPRGAPDDSPDD
ncbi:MAG: hypothetical protein Q8O61_06920 [Nocardioides sp.]|nr:hypothetical protein [Nocardioides sp.]